MCILTHILCSTIEHYRIHNMVLYKLMNIYIIIIIIITMSYAPISSKFKLSGAINKNKLSSNLVIVKVRES